MERILPLSHEVKLSQHTEVQAIQAQRQHWVRTLTTISAPADSFQRATADSTPLVNLDGAFAFHPHQDDPLEHFAAHPEELSAHLAALDFIHLHTVSAPSGEVRLDVASMIAQLGTFVLLPQHVLERSQVLRALLFQLSSRDETAFASVEHFLKLTAAKLVSAPPPVEAPVPDRDIEEHDDPQGEADRAHLLSRERER